MATSKSYFEYISEQLSFLDDVSYRRMMGEYIIYYRDKVIGGLYDDRFLVKAVPSAVEMMPDAEYVVPYENAKEMILIEDAENREFLSDLFNAMYDELPKTVKRRK